MMITVFTPTYNRAYRIVDLYESLKRQTFKDFEWLIVDDGSQDDTRMLVEKWITDGRINIRYIYKSNGGKHRAVNVGAQEAKGELFYIVDSDDRLPNDALELTAKYYEQIKDNGEFSGVCGLKCYFDGSPVKALLPSETLDCYSLNPPIVCDMAEAFKISVVREFLFPDYPGENFCAESLMFNRIGAKYKMRYFNKNVYECEYLPDGLSAASIRNRRNSPTYATNIYLDWMRFHVSWKKKIQSAINFWRFFFFMPNKKREFVKQLPFFAWVFIPFGLLMTIKDSRNINRDLRPKNKAKV